MNNTVKWNVLTRKSGIWAWRILRFILLCGLGYTLLSPFFIMISGAFRAEEDLWNPSVVWLTRHFTLEHLKSVMQVMNYWSVLKNTALIAIGSSLLQMFACAFAGYGFARFNFKCKGLFFGIVILTIMVPSQVLMMPLYNIYRTFNLLDNAASFWITSAFGMGLRSGLFIFIYRQAFRALPMDLEEAASIDGCGHMGIFFKIMLPNAVNSMITVFLFSFIWHSTDYYTTTIMMPTKQTLTTSLSILSSQLASVISGSSQSTVSSLVLQSRMQAGSLLTVIPLLIVFIFCQKYFRSGIERSGLVG